MRAYLRPSEVEPGVAGAERAESPQESALTVEDMIRAGVGHDRGGNYALPPEASLPGELERDSHHTSEELCDPSTLLTAGGDAKSTQNTHVTQKRQAAGVPAWDVSKKHSFEIHKWISDNARMRTGPVALALMLTEWPAEVKAGFY